MDYFMRDDPLASREKVKQAFERHMPPNYSGYIRPLRPSERIVDDEPNEGWLGLYDADGARMGWGKDLRILRARAEIRGATVYELH